MKADDRPNSPWFRFETLAFVLFLLVSLSVYRFTAFADPGSFWHTRFGLIMLERGAFITHDEFTGPFYGQPWRPQQWLAEILMAIVYKLGEWDLMLLLFAGFLATMYSWLTARLREAGVPVVFAILVSATIWFGAFFHAFIRAHMFTILLTAWTLARLVDFERGRIGLRGLAVLIPVNILWTNLHGGVIGGLMMHALCGAWWLIAWVLKLPTPIKDFRHALSFCSISILCALAPIVNPYGLGMFEIWTKIVGSKAMKAHVLEHKPLSLTDGAGQFVVGTVAVLIIFMLTTRGRGFRITWVMPVIWLGLSFLGIRQGPLAMVTSVVILADVWSHSIGKHLTVVNPVPHSRRWLVVPMLLMCVLSLVHIAGIRCPLIGRGWAKHDEAAWPVPILPEIKAAVAKVPPGSIIYNDTITGGFLIWHTPSIRVFIDDRFELCGDEWLDRYCTSGASIFDEWDAQYHFPLALVTTEPNKPSALETYLLDRPTEWRLIARHPAAVLFEKVKPSE